MKKWIANRDFMKSHFASEAFISEESDQMKGVKQPPLEPAVSPDAQTISLPDPLVSTEKQGLSDCIAFRRSRRVFTGASISLHQLSYLLWATQGVTLTKSAYDGRGSVTLRTVPSAGARHPFTTYLALNSVQGIKPGIYRYSALLHEIVFLFAPDNMHEKLVEAAKGQRFVTTASVVFFWAATPYLTEWRYKGESHKLILLDAGHICQNLYLASESLGLGTVAVAAYSQTHVDSLLKLDGVDEFVVYLAPVGVISTTGSVH